MQTRDVSQINQEISEQLDRLYALSESSDNESLLQAEFIRATELFLELLTLKKQAISADQSQTEQERQDLLAQEEYITKEKITALAVALDTKRESHLTS